MERFSAQMQSALQGSKEYQLYYEFKNNAYLYHHFSLSPYVEYGLEKYNARRISRGVSGKRSVFASVHKIALASICDDHHQSFR